MKPSAVILTKLRGVSSGDEYRVSHKFVRTRETSHLCQSCLFQSDKTSYIFLRYLFIGIFNFCIFLPKVCTRVYIFSPNICRILCPELLTIFPRFFEYHERCTLLMLKSSATWEPKSLYLDLLACQLKKFSESWKNLSVCSEMVVKKWRVWRQEKNGKTENP